MLRPPVTSMKILSRAALALSAAATFALTAPAATRTPVDPAARWPRSRTIDLHPEVRLHSEDLWNTGHGQESLAYLDSVAGAGRARNDSALVLAARIWRARRMLSGTQGAEAGALMDTLEREARALGSAEAQGWILDNRAVITKNTTTDVPRVLAAWRNVVRFARANQLDYIEGHAHYMCGTVLNYDGRYVDALREFEASEPLLPPSSATHVLLPLDRGVALNAMGRLDEARKTYQKGLEFCRKYHRPEYARYYMNNLAVIEYNENDPAAALPYIEQALALPRTAGDSVRTQGFELSRAWTIYRIGPPERGLAELRPLEAACERTGDPSNLTTVHSYLSEAYSDAGEYEPALRHVLRSLEFAGRSSAEARAYGANTLARCLRLSGRLEAALAVVDSILGDHPEDRRISDLLDSRMIQIDLLLRLGRLDRAEVAARAADRQARPDGPLKGTNWQEVGSLLARVHRERGRPDSALAQLRRLRLDWERRRDTITRTEWRENRGSSAATLFAELGLTLLDARRHVPERTRVRQAFDALQQFQARTLEERMQGAGASALAMARRITADSLQRSLLRPDEVLLDFVATPDTTLAFAVTRTSIVVRALPGLRILGPRVQRIVSAMESAREGSGPDAALRWISEQVLGPFGPLVDTHPRIVITGGGALALLPWAALPGTDGRPLLEAHEIVVAPSATLWANERNVRAAPPGGSDLVVLGRTTDAAGHDLDGVRRECRALGNYARVTSRVHDGSRPLAGLVGDLDRFGGIHVAAHSFSDNMSPWRSGVLMGRGAGDDAYLRASDIARRRLAARLVVLSGCQSAAARSLPGEGPLGLASAFLCAGAPTVVATLWNVRDEAAADFTARFYASLARGASAGSALRAAQRDMLAAGRPPADWAAFVLWGSGDTTYPLRRAAGR
jgi:tetratricopeptide (TPR) repeat protein